MLRYLAYLAIYIPVQLFAYLITPLLPLFAVKRMGNTDNNRYQSVEWRLPIWLSWFDTPDNSLYGDDNWYEAHKPNYFSAVAWLYRNSLYGFKWSVLAAPNNPKVCTVIEGATNLNHHTGTYGVMRITRTDGYWQLKIVTPSKVFKGRIWVLNFGWLLDDPSQEKALFMCSPRLK
jgi:hypothetical protein